MSLVDEGLIHAWIDGQLSSDEAARVERLVASDAAWSAAAADARGLAAGASRILGALDDVPALGSRSGARGVKRRRSLSPWMRAAASVVLLAGVTGLLRVAIPRRNDATVQATAADSAAAGALAAQPVIVAAPSVTTPPQPTLQTAPIARRPQILREEPARVKADQRADAPPSTTTGSATGGAAGAAAGAAAGTGAAAGAGAAAEVRAAGSVVNEAPPARAVPLIAPGAALAAGGRGGGRGGRGGRADALDVAAKAASAARSVDLLLGRCWMPVDSTEAAGNRIAERDVFVLRFITSTVTDAPKDASRSVVAQAEAVSARQVPAGTRVQNATPRALSDSTYVTEWFQKDAHVQLTFTLRGDTLRGTTVRVVGDMVFPAPSMVALRTTCPP